MLQALHVNETFSQETRISASRQLLFLRDDVHQHASCGDEEQGINDVEKCILDVKCEPLISDDEQKISGGERLIPDGERKILGAEHAQPQSPISTTKAKRVH